MERYRIEIVNLETGSTELFCGLASASEADLCLKRAWLRCFKAVEAGYPLWLSPLQEGHFELRKAPRGPGVLAYRISPPPEPQNSPLDIPLRV